MDALEQGVRGGQKRATSRLISLVENEDPEGQAILQRLHADSGRAHVIGITGSPGTGKSTLTDALIAYYRKAGKKVGVIAVDPSSPFTGGAILGDRIRMQSRSTDPGVFIRSMGTRGALGGLASHTQDAVKILDASGYDVILVETVGVGQAEVDVVRLADTVLVVLVPNLGDDVQAVKAGLMEIADIFVVNKADLMGADKVQSEVEASLMLAHPEGDEPWTPPICATVAQRGTGVEALAEAVAAHVAWSQKTGAWDTRRRRRVQDHVRAWVTKLALARGFTSRGDVRPEHQALLERVAQGQTSPMDAAKEILGR